MATTTWRAVQRAATPDAGVLAGFLMGSFKELDSKLKAALPGVGLALSPEKPFSRMPPPDALPGELMAAAELVDAVGGGPQILAGFSAGCGTVRNYLLGGVKPDVVITLDGTTGNWPTLAPRQLEVWKELAERARANECLWIATATQQSYTEALRPTADRPKDFPFWWTRHLLEEACGVKLPPGTEHHDGGLHLLSYPSARIDGPAHIAQLQSVFPDVLARIVAPWLAGKPHLENTPVEVTGHSATAEGVGWGEAVLDAAKFFMNLGIREQGFNAGSRLEHYFLEPLKLPRGSSYCAAFVAACIRHAAARLGRQPITTGSPGAKATAEPFKPLGLYVPQGSGFDGRAIAEALKPGALIIKDRSKIGPGETDFKGHIGVVIERVGERSAGMIEANADRIREPITGEIEAVCQSEWKLNDPDVLGVCLWPN